ncbi:nicotinate phosphoribosyltransferase [Coemansia thaxteri]|nr:nicotinate phosphoribosyltransferase [Coemansia thaxteri]
MLSVEERAPASILDQDLQKFCMQQAVLEHYPLATAEYEFINRDPSTLFNRASFEWLQGQIAKLGDIRVTVEELEYLRTACPYLSAKYLAFLSGFCFNPAVEVCCSLDEGAGTLNLRVRGAWVQVILYEVPLLALVAEAHYRLVETDWCHEGQRENTAAKGARLTQAGCRFAEFGTRRRRDFKTQDIVVSELARFKPSSNHVGGMTGTSNVYLARKYGVSPVGTVGHEWVMGVAAIEDTYEHANRLALQKWHQTFRGCLGIALTDTLSTKAFFADFDHAMVVKYAGVRHDSGDPLAFAQAVSEHYAKLGIDSSTKTIVFSDSLTPDTAVNIKQHCDQSGIGCMFGIGTNFTNDYRRASNAASASSALNIVIKLLKCNNRPCVKLSDDKTKYTGDPDEVHRAQFPYQCPHKAAVTSSHCGDDFVPEYCSDSVLTKTVTHTKSVSTPTVYSTQVETCTPDTSTITKCYTQTSMVVVPTTYTNVSPTTVYSTKPTYLTLTEVSTVTSTTPTTIHHAVPTYLTLTEPTTIYHTTPSPTTVVQHIPTSVTTTEVHLCTLTTTAYATVTNLATTTAVLTQKVTSTLTELSRVTETSISQVFKTITEQSVDLQTKYQTCYDTVVECCPVTVCQHVCDTIVETCTKTCMEYCPVTIEHLQTEVVPSAVSVTETELQTVTMCQPVTVSVPITEYDTICQIVTVDHTATMTKPVLVVQNVCTEAPAAAAAAAPPSPPPYGAAAAAPALYGLNNHDAVADADVGDDDYGTVVKKSARKAVKHAVAKKAKSF